MAYSNMAFPKGNTNREPLSPDEYEYARKIVSDCKVGVKFSNEHKEKLRISHKEMWTDDKKKSQSIMMKNRYKTGWKHPMLGKTHDKDAKEKISISHKGKITWNAKNILCVETGITYRSCKQAEEITGISNIPAVIRGKRKTAGGYH